LLTKRLILIKFPPWSLLGRTNFAFSRKEPQFESLFLNQGHSFLTSFAAAKGTFNVDSSSREESVMHTQHILKKTLIRLANKLG